MPLRRNRDAVAPERLPRYAGTPTPLRRNGRVAQRRSVQKWLSLCCAGGKDSRPCHSWGAVTRLNACFSAILPISRKKSNFFVSSPVRGMFKRRKICYTTFLKFGGIRMKMIRTSKMGRCGGAFESAACACPQNASGRVLTHPLASKYPPPLFARDAVAGFCAAFPGCRDCGPCPTFCAVSDGTAADCFSLSSSSQQRSLARMPGVFVRETQVNPQKQQKGNKKQ